MIADPGDGHFDVVVSVDCNPLRPLLASSALDKDRQGVKVWVHVPEGMEPPKPTLHDETPDVMEDELMEELAPEEREALLEMAEGRLLSLSGAGETTEVALPINDGINAQSEAAATQVDNVDNNNNGMDGSAIAFVTNNDEHQREVENNNDNQMQVE